jgi:hypothetical protein
MAATLLDLAKTLKECYRMNTYQNYDNWEYTTTDHNFGLTIEDYAAKYIKEYRERVEAAKLITPEEARSAKTLPSADEVRAALMA